MRYYYSNKTGRRSREEMPALYAKETGYREESYQTEEAPPFYQRPEYGSVLEEEKMMERDLRRLQAMYPETAKKILPYIMEACDRMEYEGSAMFDEYPDRTTVQRMEDEVYEKAADGRMEDDMRAGMPGAGVYEEMESDDMPMQTPEAEKEEDSSSFGQSGPDYGMIQMEYGRRRRRSDWRRDLIRILLLDEMHHRRCRYKKALFNRQQNSIL